MTDKIVSENSYERYSSVIEESETGDIYLDTPNLPDIDEDETDREYRIHEMYHRRPDKLAFDLYGDSDLWWVIAQRNNWEHPVFDCFKGKTILAPHPDRVKKLLEE